MSSVARSGSRRRRIASACVEVGRQQVRPEPPERRVERLGALLEELDDRGIEADRDGARDLQHEPGTTGRAPPALAGPIAVPRAVHPQVGPDLEAVVEPDEQVLAERLDRGDLAADDAADLRDGARAGRPCGCDGPPDQVRSESRRGPEEGVALGHSGPDRIGQTPAARAASSRRASQADEHRLVEIASGGSTRVGRHRRRAVRRSRRYRRPFRRRLHRARRRRSLATRRRTTRSPYHASSSVNRPARRAAARDARTSTYVNLAAADHTVRPRCFRGLSRPNSSGRYGSHDRRTVEVRDHSPRISSIKSWIEPSYGTCGDIRPTGRAAPLAA